MSQTCKVNYCTNEVDENGSYCTGHSRSLAYSSGEGFTVRMVNDGIGPEAEAGAWRVFRAQRKALWSAAFELLQAGKADVRLAADKILAAAVDYRIACQTCSEAFHTMAAEDPAEWERMERAASWVDPEVGMNADGRQCPCGHTIWKQRVEHFSCEPNVNPVTE